MPLLGLRLKLLPVSLATFGSPLCCLSLTPTFISDSKRPKLFILQAASTNQHKPLCLAHEPQPSVGQSAQKTARISPNGVTNC